MQQHQGYGNQQPVYQQQVYQGGNQYGGNIGYQNTEQPLLYTHPGYGQNNGPRSKKIGVITIMIVFILFIFGFWPFCLVPLCIPCDE